MTRAEEQKMDEELVLSALLSEPYTHRWELEGLAADLFTHPDLRLVARAVVHLRDHGRRVHWRRVKGLLRKHGLPAAGWVEPLRHAGSAIGLTAAVSRLHRARAERGCARGKSSPASSARETTCT